MFKKLHHATAYYARKAGLTFLGLTLALNTQAATITAKADGSWTSASIWDTGTVPGNGDNVVIPIGEKSNLQFYLNSKYPNFNPLWNAGVQPDY